MPRIIKSNDNIVDIPMGVSVNKKGYVYQNVSTAWVQKKNSDGKIASHEKVCIGIAVNPGPDWAKERKMYANSNFYRRQEEEEEKKEKEEASKTEDSSALDMKDDENTSSETTDSSVEPPIELKSSIYDVYPERSDSISVGLHAVISKIADESGLLKSLTEVFESENTALILDLACYMLSEESAVFQHFPHWARSQALFSSVIRTDSYISKFQKAGMTASQINLFKKKWVVLVLKDGRIYLCYDSTNVNSQAEGVFIVQKGFAKDDPTKDQVNIEYVLRQGDGLPVTFKTYPGSINDLSEASEIIAFFKEALKSFQANTKAAGNDGSAGNNRKTDEKTKDVSNDDADNSSTEARSPEMDTKPEAVLIADRGYISEDNIRGIRDGGLGFLMMLKRNMDIHDEILDAHISDVKKMANYLPDYHSFCLTVEEKLFKDDEEKTFFHILWDSDLEVSHRSSLHAEIERIQKTLKNYVRRKTLVTEEEIGRLEAYYDIECHKGGTLLVNLRGKGAGKTKTVDAYVIDSFKKNDKRIEMEDKRCGYLLYVSNIIKTGLEAIQAMSKRDIVEKMFMALKSMLGMDKLGVHFDASMQTKTLIWFVASILHSILFTKTEVLRVKDRKSFTTPALINLLEEITADKDLETGKYTRRYKPTGKQLKVLKCFDLSASSIDEIIASL